MPAAKKKPSSEIEIGDIIVYANKERDLIVGLPKVNGAPAFLVQPMDGRKAWMASDALKDRGWIESMLRAEVFTLVKGVDGVDPHTGVILEADKGRDIAALELALDVAQRALDAAKAKHGDEDLANIRDEWELHRRLRSALGAKRDGL